MTPDPVPAVGQIENGARASALAGAAIILWLSEVIPPYVTSLTLIAAIPLLLGSMRPQFGIGPVLTWAANPVMALFFGGFVLNVAASRHGIDEFVAERALGRARHDPPRPSAGQFGRQATV